MRRIVLGVASNKESVVEKTLGKGTLYRSISPAVLPASFVGAGTLPSRSCEQPSCRSEATFASSSSQYVPLRMQSKSSFSLVDMQEILQKHTSVYCQHHLPNRPSAFDTACPLICRTSGMAYPWLEVWRTAFGGGISYFAVSPSAWYSLAEAM